MKIQTKNIDGILKTFDNPTSFIEYCNTIYTENEEEDTPIERPTNIHDWLNYLFAYTELYIDIVA